MNATPEGSGPEHSDVLCEVFYRSFLDFFISPVEWHDEAAGLKSAHTAHCRTRARCGSGEAGGQARRLNPHTSTTGHRRVAGHYP